MPRYLLQVPGKRRKKKKDRVLGQPKSVQFSRDERKTPLDLGLSLFLPRKGGKRCGSSLINHESSSQAESANAKKILCPCLDIEKTTEKKRKH